jgi:small subunit ribosomal protein S1
MELDKDTTEEVVDQKEDSQEAETIVAESEEPTKATEEPTKEVTEATEEPTEEVATATEEPAAEEEETEQEDEIEEEEPVEDKGAHDDFDWTIGRKHSLTYTEEEIAKYTADYEKALSTLEENAIVKGRVTSFSGGDVVLDIGYKSDGLVSSSEFRDIPELSVGDFVDVYVEATEDVRGQLLLSRRKAKLLKAWENLVDSYKNGTIIKGIITHKTKGGLIADCGGLETFLPGSQIDIKPIIDYDSYVGKTMEFKVVKINEAIKNAVVSHKALIESDLAEQREHIISGLEKGQVLEGIVKNITDFGAFMDLGGVDGLLYITDISWGRINHPNEVLELNQKINVVVLDFDENKKRISLGLKQLQPHPWDILDQDVKEGSVVKGKIVNIEDYGAFLEIIPGVEGLIHVSEVNWSTQPVNARSFFDIGQEYEAKVVTIDREERKMSLSIKQLSEDPWSSIESKFPPNSKHQGEVKNLTPYGVFVELEEGIGGMIHISDLSWTKRFNHPSEYTKVGEKIDIMILEIDTEDRKLALGHKQLEENPWDTFENVFPVGSYHEVTIMKKDDRGAVVQLPYGLEAYAPIKHLRKEDNSSAEMEETLTVKVIEFNRDDKRIVVSHSRYLDDLKRKADDDVRREKGQQRRKTDKALRSHKTKLEKTTLGELDVFSQLKDQLKQSENDQKKTTTKEKKESKPKAETKPKAAKSAGKTAGGGSDDLKKIEGVGPKIAEILTEAGLETFEKLAKTDAEKIREVLVAAGSRYKMFDPTTWPQQAGLAADGKWDELSSLQDDLKGGKA